MQRLNPLFLFEYSLLVQVWANHSRSYTISDDKKPGLRALACLRLHPIFFFDFSIGDVPDKSGIVRMLPRGPGIEREFNREFLPTFP